MWFIQLRPLLYGHLIYTLLLPLKLHGHCKKLSVGHKPVTPLFRGLRKVDEIDIIFVTFRMMSSNNNPILSDLSRTLKKRAHQKFFHGLG